MTEALCGVCNAQPKKYKCPTCALPYCSLPCFKIHKTSHPETAPSPSPSQPTEPTLLPQASLPAPPPRYLKQKTDFSVLATNPKLQELLKTHPTLLSSLQRVYARTIQPDPEDEARRRTLERNAFRGRGSRGRGRGRGSGRGGWNAAPPSKEPRWTPKKGDADAMGMLKGMRNGQGREGEEGAMSEFMELVQELLAEGDKREEGGV